MDLCGTPPGTGGLSRRSSLHSATIYGRLGLSAKVGKRPRPRTSSSSRCARSWIDGCCCIRKKKVCRTSEV